MSDKKKKVLFICTHNSGRSQIGEALLKKLYPDKYEVYSAGTEVSKVNPYVSKVMSEIGIDISQNRSKHLDEFLGKIEFDYIITVCDNAKQHCPFFPGAKYYIHQKFNDPSQFKGTDEEIMNSVRILKDEIKDWIENVFIKEKFDSNKFSIKLDSTIILNANDAR